MSVSSQEHFWFCTALCYLRQNSGNYAIVAQLQELTLTPNIFCVDIFRLYAVCSSKFKALLEFADCAIVVKN
jgi:hypothetical protein